MERSTSWINSDNFQENSTLPFSRLSLVTDTESLTFSEKMTSPTWFGWEDPIPNHHLKTGIRNLNDWMLEMQAPVVRFLSGAGNLDGGKHWPHPLFSLEGVGGENGLNALYPFVAHWPGRQLRQWQSNWQQWHWLLKWQGDFPEAGRCPGEIVIKQDGGLK